MIGQIAVAQSERDAVVDASDWYRWIWAGVDSYLLHEG